jgi:hypothetical protein
MSIGCVIVAYALYKRSALRSRFALNSQAWFGYFPDQSLSKKPLFCSPSR